MLFHASGCFSDTFHHTLFESFGMSLHLCSVEDIILHHDGVDMAVVVGTLAEIVMALATP